MSNKKSNLRQRFSSGNCVEIYFREVEPKIYDAECRWDNFPPSAADVSEYKELVQPRMARLMQKLLTQEQARLN